MEKDNIEKKNIDNRKGHPKTIGIPRALYFYKYGPLWNAFLEKLGFQIVYSPPTTSDIVELGSKMATSELCVPMKIYFGHILYLIKENQDLDYIFIPRYVSTHSEQFFCPKFLALPEAVKYSLNPPISIITLEFNIKKITEKESFLKFGKVLNKSYTEILAAWNYAKEQYQNFQELVRTKDYISELVQIDKNPKHKLAPKNFKSEVPENLKGKFPLNILLLGHPYNVYENYININLIDRLKSMDCNIFTIEKMKEEIFNKKVTINQQYQQYWQTEDEILKTARYFLNEGRKEIDGVIFLISFACGPDSLIQEIVMRDMSEKKIPYLSLILDEHSGESGMVTRVQALIEMIRRKKYL